MAGVSLEHNISEILYVRQVMISHALPSRTTVVNRLLFGITLAIAAITMLTACGKAYFGGPTINRPAKVSPYDTHKERVYKEKHGFGDIGGTWNWVSLAVMECPNPRPDEIKQFQAEEGNQWIFLTDSIKVMKDGKVQRIFLYTWDVKQKKNKIVLKEGRKKLVGTFGSTGNNMILEFPGNFFSAGNKWTGCREALTFLRAQED
jgi:hypothetical protein